MIRSILVVLAICLMAFTGKPTLLVNGEQFDKQSFKAGQTTFTLQLPEGATEEGLKIKVMPVEGKRPISVTIYTSVSGFNANAAGMISQVMGQTAMKADRIVISVKSPTIPEAVFQIPLQ